MKCADMKLSSCLVTESFFKPVNGRYLYVIQTLWKSREVAGAFCATSWALKDCKKKRQMMSRSRCMSRPTSRALVFVLEKPNTLRSVVLDETKLCCASGHRDIRQSFKQIPGTLRCLASWSCFLDHSFCLKNL